jgi:hypothetical protein
MAKLSTKLKYSIRILGIIFIAVILFFMGRSYIILISDNSDNFLNLQDTTIEGNITELSLNITIPFELENNGDFDLSESNVNMIFSNGTHQHTLNLIVIPKIPQNTIYRSQKSIVISLNNLTEYLKIYTLFKTVDLINFDIRLGLFWSSLIIRGNIQLEDGLNVF